METALSVLILAVLIAAVPVVFYGAFQVLSELYYSIERSIREWQLDRFIEKRKREVEKRKGEGQ